MSNKVLFFPKDKLETAPQSLEEVISKIDDLTNRLNQMIRIEELEALELERQAHEKLENIELQLKMSEKNNTLETD
jgi:exonuclease VII small subunit